MKQFILLGKSLLGSLRDLMPIILVVGFFQLVVIQQPIPDFTEIFVGTVFIIVGLTLFVHGLETGLFPIGETMAYEFASKGSLMWLLLFAFALGFGTTIAEPALIAVAIKAHQISAGAITVWGLRVAVAIGAATGIALGTFRIVTGTPLHYYIIAGYVVVVIQTVFAPRVIIALAYDSGGVTTSTVTVPLVAALGLGLASTVPGRTPLLDGFGLIAFTCLFPIMTVMGYAQVGEWWVRRGKAKRRKARPGV